VSTGGQWVIQSEAPKAKRRPQAAASNDGKYFLIVPKGPKLFGTFLLIFNIKSRSCQQEPSATVEAGAQRQTTNQPQPEPQLKAVLRLILFYFKYLFFILNKMKRLITIFISFYFSY